MSSCVSQKNNPSLFEPVALGHVLYRLILKRMDVSVSSTVEEDRDRSSVTIPEGRKFADTHCRQHFRASPINLEVTSPGNANVNTNTYSEPRTSDLGRSSDHPGPVPSRSDLLTGNI